MHIDIGRGGLVRVRVRGGAGDGVSSNSSHFLSKVPFHFGYEGYIVAVGSSQGRLSTAYYLMRKEYES